MSVIPLDFQRRYERRWAARFSRPTELVASRNQRPEREGQQIAGPSKSIETSICGVSAHLSPRPSLAVTA
jgi:hypothetical protein